jgi:hypothetical protein
MGPYAMREALDESAIVACANAGDAGGDIHVIGCDPFECGDGVERVDRDRVGRVRG